MIAHKASKVGSGIAARAGKGMTKTVTIQFFLDTTFVRSLSARDAVSAGGR